MSITHDDPRGKTLPADPATAEAFDAALRRVYDLYATGEPLSRADLAALITAATRLMREVSR